MLIIVIVSRVSTNHFSQYIEIDKAPTRLREQAHNLNSIVSNFKV